MKKAEIFCISACLLALDLFLKAASPEWSVKYV